MTTTQLIKASDAAALLGVAPNTLAKQRMRGDGPPFVKFGRGRSAHVRYRVADLEAWVAAQTRTSTSEAH